jgi:hypothetical protein
LTGFRLKNLDGGLPEKVNHDLIDPDLNEVLAVTTTLQDGIKRECD